ncbi:apolipoprotein L3-like [Notamacropus eugenii]|uniref:apolipoprotein L3-like n=1 Tax=Notamacropus eugenii TaxID=9315 RepID=UPI003B681170
MDDSDKEMQEIQKMKTFLDDFPKTKWQLEEHIKELRLAADEIDTIHKNCTITSVVASSAGAFSGILTILGLALAPVTAGASLALSVGGMGLGATAAVTGISASVVDHVTVSRGISQLDSMEGIINDILERVCKSVVQIPASVEQLRGTFKNFTPNARALRMLRSGSMSTTGQINRTFAGTVLDMTRKARITGALSAGGFLLLDIANIVQDSIHLSKGAKATIAEKLREKAQHLEEKLQELSEIYQTLLEMDTQSRT